MKRLIAAWILAALMLLMWLPSAAAKDHSLTIKYVPRTQRGTLFYLDVYCDSVIGAAVFELGFDASAAEYRDAFCEDENGSAMGNPNGDTAKIAFSHRSGVSGRLFRVAFKALDTGTVRFSLHPVQAVDGSSRYLNDLPDCSLDVKFGEDDVVEAGASASGEAADTPAARQKSASGSGVGSKKSSAGADKSKKRDSGSEKPGREDKQSYGGSRSDVSEPDDIASPKITEADGGVFHDFSGQDNTTFFILGGASVILAGLLVVVGILIGKRMKKKRPLSEEDESDDGRQIAEEGEEAALPDAPEMPENDLPPTAEEVFRDIE